MVFGSARLSLMVFLVIGLAASACMSKNETSSTPGKATPESSSGTGESETYGAVDLDEKLVTSEADWDVSKIESDLSASMMAQVFLKNGIKIEPFAYQVKLVGMTEAPDSAPPVLLFSGRECLDCDADKGLYLYSAPDKMALRLAYPGDYHRASQVKGAPTRRIRFYYGNCLSDSKRQLIHVSEEQSGGGRGYVRTIQIREIDTDGKIKPTETRESFAEETDVIDRVKRGSCQEVKPEHFELK